MVLDKSFFVQNVFCCWKSSDVIYCIIDIIDNKDLKKKQNKTKVRRKQKARRSLNKFCVLTKCVSHKQKCVHNKSSKFTNWVTTHSTPTKLEPDVVSTPDRNCVALTFLCPFLNNFRAFVEIAFYSCACVVVKCIQKKCVHWQQQLNRRQQTHNKSPYS